jgi:HD-like signal output (HDOD) protein
MSSFEQRLEQVTELISLPEIYLKIRRLMEDPTSEIDDFAEVIRIDPSLSIAVLKLVNSAFFGFAGQIDNISRAVNMIGIGQLHNMVLGISSISALSFPNDIWPLRAFWRSSLFSGVLSRILA